MHIIFDASYSCPPFLAHNYLYILFIHCPMNGDCLKESLVYYATINCNDKNYKPKLYKGNCKTSFRKRCSNHKQSFNVPFQLSTKYRNLKMKQLYPQISWKIEGIYKSYNPTSKRCKLYLTEKLKILADPDKNLFNKRSEIISPVSSQE